MHVNMLLPLPCVAYMCPGAAPGLVLRGEPHPCKMGAGAHGQAAEWLAAPAAGGAVGTVPHARGDCLGAGEA